ncbi:uncharacterized protein LOC135811735 [Sycon ciliatum]|uniref:uncharacterized protein LOC135811735 n=1 Tax=Sycon ciliatum TaxID=27933 RepID=UPI0031F6F2F8
MFEFEFVMLLLLFLLLYFFLLLIPYIALYGGPGMFRRRSPAGTFGAACSSAHRTTSVTRAQPCRPRLLHGKHGEFTSRPLQFWREFVALRELEPRLTIIELLGTVTVTYSHAPNTVMEYSTQTLRKRCTPESALSALEEAIIALGVSSALEYVHGCGIVIGYLNLYTILLWEMATPAGLELQARIVHVSRLAELLDRGDAQLISLNSESVTYLAPECDEVSRAGEHSWRRFESASDCYSFGVSMLSVSLGREPPNLLQLMHEGREKDLEELGSDHPLRNVISKCLIRNPAHRPSAIYICRAVGVVQLPVIELLIKKRQSLPESRSRSLTLQAPAEEQTDQHSKLAVHPLGATQQSSSDRNEDEHLYQLLQELSSKLDDDQERPLDLTSIKHINTNPDQSSLLPTCMQCDNIIAALIELAHSTVARHHCLRRKLHGESGELDNVRQTLLAFPHLRNQSKQATKDMYKLLLELDTKNHRLACIILQSRAFASKVNQLEEILFELATQTSPYGDSVFATFALLAYPGRHSTAGQLGLFLPQWTPIGMLPIERGDEAGALQYHRGRLYTTLHLSPGIWKIKSADARSLSSWVLCSLPGLPRSHSHARTTLDIIADNNNLYLLVTYLREFGALVFKYREDGGWKRIVRLPAFRAKFSVHISNGTLYVVAGESRLCNVDCALPHVISVDLAVENSAWVPWPNIPGYNDVLANSTSLTSFVYDGYLHVVMYGKVDNVARPEIFSASTSRQQTVTTWKRGILGHPPPEKARFWIINGKLVCKDVRRISVGQLWLYSPVTGQWVPVLQTGGTPLSYYGVNGRMLSVNEEDNRIFELSWMQ